MLNMPRMTEEEYQARDTLRQARAAELAPQLAQLINKAQEVYLELRPRAAHVSEVPMSYPLRHQRVHTFVTR